jgi:hypothetical protein
MTVRRRAARHPVRVRDPTTSVNPTDLPSRTIAVPNQWLLLIVTVPRCGGLEAEGHAQGEAGVGVGDGDGVGQAMDQQQPDSKPV